jgi:replication factor C subunit 1
MAYNSSFQEFSIQFLELVNFIISKGGKSMGGVSGKTDMLIVGHKLEDGRSVSEGSKYRTAKQRDIQIVTEKQFE